LGLSIQVDCHPIEMVLKSAPALTMAPVLAPNLIELRLKTGNTKVAPMRELFCRSSL
jgi:hypothetical protein